VRPSRRPVTKGHWKAALSGGILYDFAPHPAYLLRGFVGPINDLKVMTRTDDRGHLRELRALVDGARALGGLTISLETRPFTNRVTLCGTAMTAEVNLNNMTLIVRRTRQAPKLLGKVLPNLDERPSCCAATLVNGVAYHSRAPGVCHPCMGVHFRALYQACRGATAAGAPRRVERAVRLAAGEWEQAGVRDAAPSGGAAGMKALVTR